MQGTSKSVVEAQLSPTKSDVIPIMSGCGVSKASVRFGNVYFSAPKPVATMANDLRRCEHSDKR
jgi:hypothetical protein